MNISMESMWERLDRMEQVQLQLSETAYRLQCCVDPVSKGLPNQGEPGTKVEVPGGFHPTFDQDFAVTVPFVSGDDTASDCSTPPDELQGPQVQAQSHPWVPRLDFSSVCVGDDTVDLDPEENQHSMGELPPDYDVEEQPYFDQHLLDDLPGQRFHQKPHQQCQYGFADAGFDRTCEAMDSPSLGANAFLPAGAAGVGFWKPRAKSAGAARKRHNMAGTYFYNPGYQNTFYAERFLAAKKAGLLPPGLTRRAFGGFVKDKEQQQEWLRPQSAQPHMKHRLQSDSSEQQPSLVRSDHLVHPLRPAHPQKAELQPV